MNIYQFYKFPLKQCLKINFNASSAILLQKLSYSTSTAEKDTITIKDDKGKDIKEVKKTKADQRPPFVKNLFLGKFDRQILTYPEILHVKERFEMLQDLLAPIRHFFQTEVDSDKIDREARISDEILKATKELGLFGLPIPVDYGGLGLNATECALITEEISSDGSIAQVISSHQDLCVNILMEYGTEEQKAKYLPSLASGELTAALCLNEPEVGNDVGALKATAIVSEEGLNLNAIKVWVVNGLHADVFFVFTRLQYPNQSQSHGDICVLIVDRNSVGISVDQPMDKIGIRGCPVTSVRFVNTLVPKENHIGERYGGFNIALTTLSAERLSFGSRICSIMKRVMKETVQHVVTNSHYGQPLSDYGMVQERLTLMELDIYAIEAMTYLTAGLIDAYENQDCSLESAIIKVYGAEKSIEHFFGCLQLVGSDTCYRNSELDRIFRDLRVALMLEGSTEVTRLFIALAGLHHSGSNINETVKKRRNPFMFPEFTFKRALKRLSGRDNKPKLDLNLFEFLHPSLRWASEVLEMGTKKFEISVEEFLGREGKGIIENKYSNQINLKRISDIAIDLYALTAVLGRASRSYCIGVHNSDHELILANLFASTVKQRIIHNTENINYFFNSDDNLFDKISNGILAKKGYALQPPTTKTSW